MNDTTSQVGPIGRADTGVAPGGGGQTGTSGLGHEQTFFGLRWEVR